MSHKPALPKIEVKKENKLYRVDWDFQEAPESGVLNRKNRELTLFIDGVLVGMGVSKKLISCATGRTGTVQKLDETTAFRLEQILKDLLHPLVTAEHKYLVSQDKLPENLRNNITKSK